MPTHGSKILKEMEETTAIAARIVALTSKQRKATAGTLGKARARKGGKAETKR